MEFIVVTSLEYSDISDSDDCDERLVNASQDAERKVHCCVPY
jgi:hypothetical protein